ncbi:dihydrolipoamide acetyltransferase family protein [Cellulomonas sp. SG140]|uniref:dihydrolipoamide acetyltransferase family protein n=1 Tax=Cellulomonas sp. SG140 TaxID=2976536 RepID=UPI0021E77C52|nr:dihydrolipoamide acetyltransferase family protein [Cellulomonas sp. SG140]
MPTYQQFPLPDAGEGLTEAEIVEWRVAPGDVVTVNQTIVEIETAKSLVELPSPWSGVVSRILVEVGTTVDVGTPIIEIDTDPSGTATPAAGGRAVSGAQSPHGHHEHPSRASEEPGGAEEIGAARDERAETSGSVLVGYGLGSGGSGRRPRAGAARAAGAATNPTAPAPTGASVSTPEAPAPTPAATVSAPAPAPVRPATTTNGNGSSSSVASSSATSSSAAVHALAKPPVRKLAKDLGVDLEIVTPTGPGGIVTREDVLEQANRAEGRTLATYPGDDAPWLASGTVSADGRQTRVPVKSVRKRTAEAMVTSAFTAPHVTVFHTIDVTRTMHLVQRLRADREFADVRVTPLLIAAKALLLAVHRHPEVNASWDDQTQEIVYKHYVNLGIAAATPRGLVVPNIKDAHRMNLLQLAQALGDLTATARSGKTTPTAMSDGTITITNVGVFGIDTGTPILNPGEAAILAFGAIREQPWVHKGKIKVRHVTQLALSVDHRLVDGELGSRVLADIAAILADPAQALVWG